MTLNEGKWKKPLAVAAFLLTMYVAPYCAFRVSHQEVWEKDGKNYVIFPEEILFLYYFYRPAAMVDGVLTGMNFHIGPHR